GRGGPGRPYAEGRGRGGGLLRDGKRVIVDANLREERRRRAFLDAAARLCVPALFLRCRVSPEVARQRIANRRGDASDADHVVYERAAERWQEAGPLTQPALREIITDGPRDEALAQAVEAIRRARLLG